MLTNNPSFWRLVGLLIADRDHLTTFSNTSIKLVKLFENLGNNLSPFSTKIKQKRERRKNRKPLWRVYTSGDLSKEIKRVWKNLESYISHINEDCFWQLMTGIYEGDGSVTLRPVRWRNKINLYLEVEIKFSKKEEKLAREIARRLERYGLKISLKNYRNYIRFRITSLCGVMFFFEKINPLVKNPSKRETFDPRSKNAAKIVEIFERKRREISKLGINPLEKIEDLRKFNIPPQYRVYFN